MPYPADELRLVFLSVSRVNQMDDAQLVANQRCRHVKRKVVVLKAYAAFILLTIYPQGSAATAHDARSFPVLTV